jgi:RimJ/RimL family protein N-acetyltransferase
MTFSTKGVSETHTYNGYYSEINFFTDEKDALAVTIDTARLHTRSVESSENDLNAYAALFGDSVVMEKFATGVTKTKEEMRDRIKIWVERWRHRDPYSALAVFKQGSDDFVGHVVLGHGDAPGQSELAYLSMQKYWNQKFGTEAVSAIVKEYAPATVQEGYTLEGKTLEKITATVRIDNVASVKIFDNVMKRTGKETKFGAERYTYSIGLSELYQKV